MAEGLLPGGVFRQAAPGEFEINIPGVLENPTNKLIRRAYTGLHKGESKTRTVDDKLYPRGFTPPEDYITNPDNAQGIYNISNTTKNSYQDLPVEAGVQLRLDVRVDRTLKERYLKLQEAPLKFFDAPAVQFRHLLDYYDTSGNNLINPIVEGADGNRPGVTYEFNASDGELINHTYLASSFVRTHRENEDPTLLGFDFHVRLSNSPLFNGTLEYFLEEYGKENLELRNRIPLLKEFQKQFLNFFKSYDPNHISENLPSVGQFIKGEDVNASPKSGNLTKNLLGELDPSADKKDTYLGSATKAYYVQSISGLGKLNESNEYGGDGGQRFVKWGTDALTITVNEDVSQNMGYLASLYKNLAWSREQGRLAVPENLLRFEVVLDITEIRNYVRVYHSEKTSRPDSTVQEINKNATKNWIEIADQTSKYRYFVHDCQLFFPAMPHGDTLTTSPVEAVKGVDLKIFFKHSNLRFMKFNAPYSAKVEDDNYTNYHQRYNSNKIGVTDDYFRIKVVDNNEVFAKEDASGDFLIKGGAESGVKRKTIFQDGNGEATSRNTSPIGYPVQIFNDYTESQVDNTSDIESEQARRDAINQQDSFIDKLNVGKKDLLKGLKRKALNIGQNLANRALVSVASLVNRSLNQIFNSLPIVGGIPPPGNVYGYKKPKNLYDGSNPANRPEWEQAYIDFIGPGLKTFFSDPTKFRQEGTPGETLEQKIIRGRQSDPNPRPGRTKNYFESANAAIETSKNLKLKEIVDSDPNLGNANSGASTGFFSFNPELGNLARSTSNQRTLSQIVDSDPNLGNGKSGITGGFFSFNPNLGNSAKSTSNQRTLTEIVDSDPNLGNGSKLLKGYFSTNPGLGNNATTGGNLNLLNIVMNNSIITTLGAFDWNDIQFPSSAQRLPDPTTTGSLSLNNVVGQNSTLVNSGLGNSGTVGTNIINDLLVLANTQVINADEGNSALTGINVLNDEVVLLNTEVSNADEGNSALDGINVLNDLVVLLNTEVSNADEGNSALDGINVLNDLVVLSNTEVSNPDEGNSALTGDNVLNDLVVLSNTVVSNPDEGNSALTGENILNSDLVTTTSKVKNPEQGNQGQIGRNIENSKLISIKSKLVNPYEGNSGFLSINIKTDKLIQGKSKVENSEIGNSGNVGVNNKSDYLVSNKSEVENPNLANKGTFGDNNKIDEIVESKSGLINPEIGNNADQKANLPKGIIVDINTNLNNPEQGNSAILGVNNKKDVIISENSNLEDTNIGNSAILGTNVTTDVKVDKNSQVDDTYGGNSATLGYNSTKEQIIKNYSGVDNPDSANSALLGSNYRNDLNVDLNSEVNNSEIGNSASPGKTKKVSDIVEKQSKVENPDLSNGALTGKNLNLNDTSRYSNSRVYGKVDWNDIKFPKSSNNNKRPTP